MKSALLLLALILSYNSIAAINEEWKGYSAPEIMDPSFTHVVEALPLEGTILGNHTRAWSGHYWPSREGGVNVRWNTLDRKGFKYDSPTKEELLGMSLDQRAGLAPTEKYDLFLGRYDYPLKEEAKGTANKHAKDWAGICHGWAPASLHHEEPMAKVMTNPDGIQIPFGSADIKALLSYYYAFYHETESTHQIGLRCYFGGWTGGTMRACDEDLNAGAFHIIIANRLGLQKKGFLMDADRFNEVWNQPVVGFKTKILDAYLPPHKKAAKSAVREMRFATELFYTDESSPEWNVVYGTTAQIIAKKDLQYRIEIDAKGKIVGGVWESKVRPDFLWYREKAYQFNELFSRLPELLND
jgi:hypothetical protein